MADNTGIDRRTEIDNLTVKALLTLNSGGVVALLAFAQAIMGQPMYQELLKAVFGAIAFFVVGLGFAVIHNIYRRKCEHLYESKGFRPPKGRVLGVTLWEPGICAFRDVCRGFSLLLFMLGSLWVSCKGWALTGITG